MNAVQRENRLPASSQYVRTSPDSRNSSAATMWMKRMTENRSPPAGMRNGSAMYRPVTLSVMIVAAVSQCVSRTGICQM